MSMKNNRLTYITMQVKGSVIEAEVAHQLPTRVAAFSNLMRFTMEHSGSQSFPYQYFQTIIKETCFLKVVFPRINI